MVWRPESRATVCTCHTEVVTQHLQIGCRQDQDVVPLLLCNLEDACDKDANLDYVTEQEDREI